MNVEFYGKIYKERYIPLECLFSSSLGTYTPIEEKLIKFIENPRSEFIVIPKLHEYSFLFRKESYDMNGIRIFEVEGKEYKEEKRVLEVESNTIKIYLDYIIKTIKITEEEKEEIITVMVEDKKKKLNIIQNNKITQPTEKPKRKWF